MSDTPWSGDVVGLVEAFRAGERGPSEELEATLAAVEANDLNAVCHVDAEAARVAAAVDREGRTPRRLAARVPTWWVPRWVPR